jgi:hypothetical protein
MLSMNLFAKKADVDSLLCTCSTAQQSAATMSIVVRVLKVRWFKRMGLSCELNLLVLVAGALQLHRPQGALTTL